MISLATFNLWDRADRLWQGEAEMTTLDSTQRGRRDSGMTWEEFSHLLHQRFGGDDAKDLRHTKFDTLR